MKHFSLKAEDYPSIALPLPPPELPDENVALQPQIAMKSTTKDLCDLNFILLPTVFLYKVSDSTESAAGLYHRFIEFLNRLRIEFFVLQSYITRHMLSKFPEKLEKS